MEDIKLARNFGELCEAIRQKEEIQGSKFKYKASYLLDLIDDLRTALEEERIVPLNNQEIQKFYERNKHLFEKITQSEGLRKKVIQLSIKTAIFMSKQDEQ